MQYLIFILGNIVFATLDMSFSKSQCKFFGLIIILLLHVFFNFSNNILYVSCFLFLILQKK